ncbi:MAG TPA: hypothetical protein DEG17_00825 [Cyanobacteria bacterium UBA11149]|nr:hypothetical protein [Cyanobacteria bacterium UBA11367]HBE57800.1 hypothetical protein [Cyanobacteria bacterium UBA11366]HBK65614.1 hypothetical protein [Cyanobacteria bacterium UBA11166]HBR73433.1 hypothetical protein [Cyanobacteria bacterium UBA11159]HBS68375.1 hypothetical protein [Cyanobacteria bacterium UBA11153]HBW87456.1 hypothetical protein [Cyanobacteria bacterium UBA11149]HCA93857.1 hypothetical protein [Cyanobacteria bacterium UBA9226]
MSTGAKYWTIVKIDGAGGRKVEEIESAKVFFLASFPEFTADCEVPDALIQRQLLHWLKGGNYEDIDKDIFQKIEVKTDSKFSEPSVLAQLCLKCFICGEIERVCQELAMQFGEDRGFTCGDLLPIVLDEDGGRKEREKKTNYQSFVEDILYSFDPDRSSLSTWTTRRVKSNKDINKFLVEQGIYLLSDWAILNDTTPKQIERIFLQFYQLTRLEVEEDKRLLESYHAVYRVQRLKQRQSGIKGACIPPTSGQLEQISQDLSGKINRNIPGTILLRKLQNLASRLREYRIRVRGGSIPNDEREPIRLAETIPDPHSDILDDETEFLKVYRQEFRTCLDGAIAQVTENRLKILETRDKEKAGKFIIALQLFHCQAQSMSEIAKLLDLKAQFHVSRLLKLKDFRADVQQQLLILLRDRVFAQAQAYTDTQHLQNLYQEIEAALNEQISDLIKDATMEASRATVEKHHTTSSFFAQRLCYYLDIRSLCHE